jgi:diadenosine tetraphosphatase ApaH/serine/threonine PP2A family protein phosphatase
MIQMKWAILSDVHGNLEALEAVLKDLKKEEPISKAILGDIVGYGANPSECLDIVRELVSLCVAGNHDAGSVGLANIEDFNFDAQNALIWTSKNIRSDQRSYLLSLPLIEKTEDFTLCHATPYEPERWHYIITYQEAIRSFKAFDTNICFVGHSHCPLILSMSENGDIESLPFSEIKLDPKCRYIINVGSIGQPRDGDPRAAYGIYDDREKVFIVKRIPYDIERASRKIEAAMLPRSLAIRLYYGR